MSGRPDLRAVDVELLEPPYPEDTKANGYRVEFDIQRIKQSRTWKLASDDVRPWLLLLWLECWESVPCGSLDDDDELIAATIGCSLEWFKVHRVQLLRGWLKHCDGRLYHPYVSDLVIEMLGRRRSSSERQRRLRSNAVSRVSHAVSRVTYAKEQEQEQEEEKKQAKKEGGKWSLPAGVDPVAWGEFEQHRKDIRKPLSNLSRTKNANILKTMPVEHQRECVNLTIANRWQGLFPKTGGNNATHQQESATQRRARINAELEDRARAHFTEMD